MTDTAEARDGARDSVRDAALVRGGVRDDAPTASLSRVRVRVAVGGLLLGTLLGALDQTVVSTALPTVVGDLGGASHLSWAVTSYLLASTASTPLWGALGDRYGRRVFFQAAIVIFLLGSVLSGRSGSMGGFIAVRALQGLGGGGLIVGAQAIIGDVAPVRDQARYQGLFGAVFAVTSVVGPWLGGVLTEHVGWRWIFYLNVPVAAFALVVTALVLPGHQPAARALEDARGAAVALLRHRVFSIAAGVSFVSGVVMFGVTLYLPLLLQVVRGVRPAASGVGLLPLMAALLATSVGSGVLISRRGRYKVVPVVGSALLTIGLYGMSTVGAGTSTLLLDAELVVLGAGLGCLLQVLVIVVQASVPHHQLGTATGAVTFFRSVGGAFGTAAFGAVFANLLAGRLGTGLRGLAVPDGLGAHVEPALLAGLPAPAHDAVVAAYESTLQTVFLCGVPVAALAFGLTLLLPEFPPRR